MPDLKRSTVAITATAVAAIGAVTLADAATSSKSQKQTQRPTPAQMQKHMQAETALTGDVKAAAEKAALAKVPGTVLRSANEDPAEGTGAAYEVHVRTSDDSIVEVLLDKDYAVIKTQAGPGFGRGRGGPGGPGRMGNPNEKPLTGDTLAKAKKAAEDKVSGGTAEFATTEDPAEKTGAAYEVHVRKSDGSHVTVLLDEDFTVIKVQADKRHGPGGRGGHHGFHGGPPPGSPPPPPGSEPGAYPGPPPGQPPATDPASTTQS